MSLVPILQLEMFKVEHIWLYSLLMDLIVLSWLTDSLLMVRKANLKLSEAKVSKHSSKITMKYKNLYISCVYFFPTKTHFKITQTVR